MNENPLFLLPELAEKFSEEKTSWILRYGSEEKMLHKMAGSDDEFEQAFFQLAYDRLQGKLYNLFPYLVGFEVVNKSDDNTKAVGVFGFKSNNGQILLVPAFFVNGKIKDLDILYSRNNNQFYPLNEDFAEVFMKDDVTGIGAPSSLNRNQFQKFISPVDFRDLAIPPRTGRTVTASVIDYIQESSNKVKTAFLNWFETYPDFALSFAEFYPVEKIAEALTHDIKDDLDIIYPSDIEKLSNLSDEDKTKALSDGYIIMDKRASSNISKFGLVNISSQFSSVTTSGVYDYITTSGFLNEGLVLTHLRSILNGFYCNQVLVYDFDGGKTFITDNGVFAKKEEKKDTKKLITQFLSKSIQPAEAEVKYSKYYILIDEQLKATQPFNIIQNFKDTHGIRRLMVEPYYSFRSNSDSNRFKNNYFKNNEVEHSRTVTLVFTKKAGNVIEFRDSYIYIPKNYKLVEVDLIKVDSSGSYNGAEVALQTASEEEATKYKRNVPGNLYHFTSLMSYKNIYPISIRKISSDIFVNSSFLDKTFSSDKEAKIGFVLNYGLSEKTANEIVELLNEKEQLCGQIKVAYTGDFTPALVDEAPYTNELGQPTYSGLPYIQIAPNDVSYTGDPTRIGLGVKGEMQDIRGDVDKAVQLARTGQKQIFDAHTIATLSKYVDPTNKVISYIPDFVSTLDKLGRMLFMINWDTDKFQKMYGNDELPELLELLKNIFKNLGDLVIFMKRKFPDISINTNEQAIDKG